MGCSVEAPKRLSNCPHYARVPKDRAGNIEWRRKLLRSGSESPAKAKALIKACSEDVLFFLNSFAFIYEPRLPLGNPDRVRPFITYEYQDDALVALRDAVGKSDVAFEKSRDMGASWISLGLVFWLWLFHPYSSMLLMSRNEAQVDATDDTDSLFAKIDFMRQRLPMWMLPRYDRSRLHLKNLENESVIDGTSTTGSAGQGGRRLLTMMDEFPLFGEELAKGALNASQYATRTRIFIGTPSYEGHPACAVMHRRRDRIVHIRLHWSQHPEYSQGLYQSRHGQVELIDKDYEFPTDYPFVLDGKLRSPYYDDQCARALSDADIAKHLDIDWGTAGSQFFDATILDRMVATTACPPRWSIPLKDVVKGTDATKGFIERCGDARIDFWCQQDHSGKPPQGKRYSIGADVAAGTGASNSVLAVFDGDTGERVAQLAWPRILEFELAIVTDYLAQMLGGARVIWEARGPGNTYGKVLWERGLRDLYYEIGDHDKKPADKPGWQPNKSSKLNLVTEFRRAIYEGDTIEKEAATLNECRQFVYSRDGGVKHISESAAEDPSGAGDNHGDRVIASALAWWTIPKSVRRDVSTPKIYPRDSFMGRRQRYMEQSKKRTEAKSHWHRMMA